MSFDQTIDHVRGRRRTRTARRGRRRFPLAGAIARLRGVRLLRARTLVAALLLAAAVPASSQKASGASANRCRNTASGSTHSTGVNEGAECGTLPG